MVRGFGVSTECQRIGTIRKKWRAVARRIFPTGPTALDFELRGRRYVKNMGHNRNRLYSRAILHTLKKEPLSIMLLHTSRTMDGP